MQPYCKLNNLNCKLNSNIYDTIFCCNIWANLSKSVSQFTKGFVRFTTDLQICRNHTSAWVFSFTFAAYFQNIFSRNTSEWLLVDLLFKVLITLCDDFVNLALIWYKNIYIRFFITNTFTSNTRLKLTKS